MNFAKELFHLKEEIAELKVKKDFLRTLILDSGIVEEGDFRVTVEHRNVTNFSALCKEFVEQKDEHYIEHKAINVFFNGEKYNPKPELKEFDLSNPVTQYVELQKALKSKTKEADKIRDELFKIEPCEQDGYSFKVESFKRMYPSPSAIFKRYSNTKIKDIDMSKYTKQCTYLYVDKKDSKRNGMFFRRK